jgi:hypothetical protein
MRARFAGVGPDMSQFIDVCSNWVYKNSSA